MVLFPPPSPDSEWDSDQEEDGLAEQTPLDINWVPVHTFRIAVCSLPGNRYAGARRSLVADLGAYSLASYPGSFPLNTHTGGKEMSLETLKKAGIQDVFVFCTDIEMHRCKVQTLLVDYAERGFTPRHHPINDDQLPCMHQWLQLLEELHSCLQDGRRTAIHCVDGYGRSCLVLTLLAMFLDEDLPPASAMELIRQARGPAAIQTVKQYNVIMEFHKSLAEFRVQQQQ